MSGATPKEAWQAESPVLAVHEIDVGTIGVVLEPPSSDYDHRHYGQLIAFAIRDVSDKYDVSVVDVFAVVCRELTDELSEVIPEIHSTNHTIN